MQAGKLDAELLQRHVLRYGGKRRGEVVLRGALGEDAAALELEAGWQLVLTTDPITAATAESGGLAVVVSCNDLAACGAEPLAVLLTLLLPERCDEQAAEAVMRSADLAARQLGVEIIGGHTEFTYGLQQVILSATAVGKVRSGCLITTAGARVGDDVVLTKGAGIEGTAILLADFPQFWQTRLSAAEIEAGLRLRDAISVLPEARIAAAAGAHAMHDVTEGGVLGALYEMAAGAGLGVLVDEDAILLNDVTRRICAELKLDPLQLISSGALLIAAADGAALVAALQEAGIDAALIGRFTEQPERRLLASGRLIDKPVGDEIWRGIKQLTALQAAR